MHDETLNNRVSTKPRATPYDTGKIKIGVYYEPPRPRQEEDEVLLQNALLGGKWQPTAHAKTKWQTLALVLGGIALYVFGLSIIMR